MNRLLALTAALALANVARAEEPPTSPPPAVAPAATPAPAPDAAAGPDLATLAGKVEANEADLAELKSAASSAKKLKISGYLQSRFAWREDARYTKTATVYDPAGITSTNPTGKKTVRDAAPSQDGFYIRRGRIKVTYDGDLAQYVLQLDATPAGVGIKEGYAAVKLPYGLAIDAGLQLMPFGYEVATRSSADLDTLERAELSRRFLKGEYDVGVALRGKYGVAAWKIGLFNGDGVDGAKGLDNDQLKDVIGRVTFDLGHVTAGLSGWWGKTRNYSEVPLTDDTAKEYDRQRFGADVQVFLDLLPIGGTAVKGEYLWGKTQLSDKNGGAGDTLGKTSSGWYALVTQNVGPVNQVAVRYEQFIVDHGVDRDLAANQKKVFVNSELQAALHTFVGANYKFSIAYFHPMYAAYGDQVTGEATDPQKDSFMLQAQAKF